MSAHHGFDPEVAADVGMSAAVIYQNIVFWCSKNAANNRNEHDGRHYTYNSISAFEELFPYLSAKQIRVALDKLESEGYIGTACLNKSPMDRTKWYCVKRQKDLPSRANGFAPEGRAIPDNKPDIKHTPRAREEISQKHLDAIWKAYPEAGKVSAAPANLPFYLKGPVTWLGGAEAVLAAVVAYAAACRKEDTKPKSLVNFLSDRALVERYGAGANVQPISEADRHRAHVFNFTRYGDWEGEGPPPGQPGCLVPPEILAEFGYGKDAA